LTTYDSRNGEVVLLAIVEELENIVTNNNAGLAAEYVLGAHVCGVSLDDSFENLCLRVSMLKVRC
jgi:hypothetical protein